MAKILIVEDDLQLSEIIARWLTNEHHIAETVADGEDALSRLKLYAYELVILDWHLPGLQGIDVLSAFRAAGGKTPVLMLTGKRSVEEKMEGLDTGADDYLTKPFHGKELTARVRALLRRPADVLDNILRVGDIELNTVTYRAHRGGNDLKLVPKEFALLQFLMRYPGRYFTASKLMSEVWPSESDASTDALTTCLKRLRRKLDYEGHDSVIKNVHGMGYSLIVGNEANKV
ncbi:MAG: response regulator transcription factor [Cyanobacteria bacterium REEB67]|nr:response regulator transcription factor [Cyanobacteria bacterium REEB67]